MSRSVCKVPLMFVNICTPFQSRLNQSCQQNNVTLTKTWPNIYLFWTEFTLGHGGSYPIQIKVANSPFLDSKFSLPSFLTLSEIWLTTIWHDMSLLWNCFHDKLKYLNKNFFPKANCWAIESTSLFACFLMNHEISRCFLAPRPLLINAMLCAFVTPAILKRAKAFKMKDGKSVKNFSC